MEPLEAGGYFVDSQLGSSAVNASGWEPCGFVEQSTAVNPQRRTVEAVKEVKARPWVGFGAAGWCPRWPHGLESVLGAVARTVLRQ